MARMASDMPVYIPTFNNPTYVKAMIRQLSEWNIRNIMLVDNGSTYGEMLRLLDHFERKQRVIRLSHNFGPRHLVVDEESYNVLPELFCVTDPDLHFNPGMPQDFMVTLISLTNIFSVGKAGLALDLSDKHLMKTEKFEVAGKHYFIWEWEEKFWSEKVGKTEAGDPIFRADVDTTFAVYNKRFYRRDKFFDAVRIGGKYTCKHLPWYRNNGLPLKEEQYYKQTQKHSYHLKADPIATTELGPEGGELTAEIMRLDGKDDHVGVFTYLHNTHYDVTHALFALYRLMIAGRFQSAFLVAKVLAGARHRNPTIDLARSIGGVLFGNQEDEAHGIEHLARWVDNMTSDQREKFRNQVAAPTFDQVLKKEVIAGNRDLEAKLLRICDIFFPERAPLRKAASTPRAKRSAKARHAAEGQDA